MTVAKDAQLPSNDRDFDDADGKATRTGANTDTREDFYGQTSVVPAPLARQAAGNPVESVGEYYPIVGSADDLMTTAPRVGYETALTSGARNSRRLAGDTPGDRLTDSD